jgi:hypothetical protein
VRCPACNAEVEDGADLCLECGEPMGDAPAARLARAEKAEEAKPSVPAAAAPTRPAVPAALVSTLRGKRSARARPDPDEEREPVRCPGCGTPSTAARCPGCGIPLRADE